MSCSCGSNNENNKGGCEESSSGKPCGCGKSGGGKIWLLVTVVVIAIVAGLSMCKDKSAPVQTNNMPEGIVAEAPKT